MKTTEQRINNIVGQLEGAKKMLSASKPDCFAVMIQLKAARSAVSALMDKIMNEEMEVCFKSKNKQQEKISKIIKEIIKQ